MRINQKQLNILWVTFTLLLPTLYLAHRDLRNTETKILFHCQPIASDSTAFLSGVS